MYAYTYKTKCDICGAVNEVPNYGEWACRNCLQGYTYEECHQITLTDAQLALLRNPPRWIPVEERLPEPHHHVIGWQPGFARTAEVWIGSSGQWIGGDFEPAGDITHWMPLPEPPKCATH